MAHALVDFTPMLKGLAPLVVVLIAIGVMKELLTPARKRKARRSSRSGGTSLFDRAAHSLVRYALSGSPAAKHTVVHVNVPPTGRPMNTPPTTWSVQALQRLEWKRFETVCTEFLSALGYVARETKFGADGGIDIILHRQAEKVPAGIAQCKAWNTCSIGVKPVRELYGVMAAERVEHGIFMTTSNYTEDALAFARGKNLELVSGQQLIAFIQQLRPEAQSSLLATAFAGDFWTPTCANCGVKMIERVAGRGAREGSSFWGCVNYPRCKNRIQIRADHQ